MRYGPVAALPLLLAACGSGGALPPAPPPDGAQITTPGIEAYTTDHNGYSRARITNATGAADAAILGQFDDGNPAQPAGYDSLITLTEPRFADNLTIEVIAETGAAPGDLTRILRMTADAAAFDNLTNDNLLIASGQFFLRGNAEVYTSVDGGALQRGVGVLENMVVDFDAETVQIHVRTLFDDTGGMNEILNAEVPLNVVTGAYGGTVTLVTRPSTSADLISADGILRGNLTGDEAGLSRLTENMATAGLFTIGEAGDPLFANGIYWGTQTNYCRDNPADCR